jgi:uncharacterized delta-60 repeat protein
LTDFHGREDVAYSVLLQPDGRLVAIGSAQTATDHEIALARYETDGGLDTSFGVGGRVTTSLSQAGDAGMAVALQPDNKIVAVGYGHNGTDWDMAVLRYTAGCTGVLDASITQLGDTLRANASGTTYQWVDCAHGWYTPIPGATQQSFVPTVSGLYALIVSQPPCSDTSECIPVTIVNPGVAERMKAPHIYPNPTSGRLTMQLPEAGSLVEVVVTDQIGRVVDRVVHRHTDELSLLLPPVAGMYFLTIEVDNAPTRHLAAVTVQ